MSNRYIWPLRFIGWLSFVGASTNLITVGIGYSNGEWLEIPDRFFVLITITIAYMIWFKYCIEAKS